MQLYPREDQLRIKPSFSAIVVYSQVSGRKSEKYTFANHRKNLTMQKILFHSVTRRKTNYQTLRSEMSSRCWVLTKELYVKETIPCKKDKLNKNITHA